MENIVAIDVGSDGTSTSLIRQNGQILARGYAEFPTVSGGSFVEQETDDWWRATCSALSHMWRSSPESTARKVAAVVLSGQMQDTILLGPEGTIGRAILYPDSRAQKEAAFLAQSIGSDRLVTITGNEQGPASVLAKWLWLKKQEPERLHNCQKILLGAHDFIAWRLCGSVTTDFTTATTTGLLDINTNCWAQELLAELELVSDLLPDLHRAGTVIGAVGDDAADATGIPAGTPVCQGVGDIGATTIGVGAGTPDSLYVYLDTSGWIAATVDHVVSSPNRGVFSLRHPDPERYIQVVPLLTATGNLTWLQNQLGHFDTRGSEVDIYSVLDEQASEAPIGSRGLIYLPYLAGELAPFNDPNARACFIGLSPHTTRADMIRAVMEGIAMAYRSLRDALGVEPSGPILLVGNAATSTQIPQILADVMGSEVRMVAETGDIAARGATIIAGRELGWYDNYSPSRSFFPSERRFRPDKRHTRVYDEIYPIFQGLYPQLKATFTAISEIKFPESG